jgi:hypothetical protein
MVYVILLALGAFMNSLGVQGNTKSWEAHEHNQQFGKNERIDIRKSQRLPKEGHSRIHKVLAMRPGFAKKIDKVRISGYFESPETDFHTADNHCGIDYAVNWLLKRFH